MGDLDKLATAVLGDHRERTSGAGKGHCVACRETWPCSPSRLAEAVTARADPMAATLDDLEAAYERSAGVLWEGPTFHVGHPSKIDAGRQPLVSQVQTGEIDARPGTRVRVVAVPTDPEDPTDE